jgi:glycosyltransferase involved in cell wall biosynthesis
LEVFFLDDQGISKRVDTGFGESFAWDIDLLGGYRSQFVKVREPRDRDRFRGIQLIEDFGSRFPKGVDHYFWVEGWRFLANWQAIARAQRAGATILMRGDSHGMLHRPWYKRLARALFLKPLLGKVDYFLCVGSANTRYYRDLGVPERKCVSAPHCVDNDRFHAEAMRWRASRDALRERWRIAPDAKVVLFCGKLQGIKNPEQISAACQRIHPRFPKLHVLYVGTGSLEGSLRRHHEVRFAWDGPHAPCETSDSRERQPLPATFAGFLNQSEIAKAYAVSDVLALPSLSETWGLVVNEAMASGLPVVVSDQVGCAEDIPARLDPRLVYRVNDIQGFADALGFALEHSWDESQIANLIDRFHVRHVVAAIAKIMARTAPLLVAEVSTL